METPTTVYIAPQGFEHVLAEELSLRGETLLWQHEQLFACAGSASATAWAQNIWLEPQFISIESIGDGASKLRALQRNWALYPLGNHRRAALISEKLPHIKKAPFIFGSPVPTAPLGGWALWDVDTILASPKCSSPFPNGEVLFAEDKVGPPSRAYLKLWETFTLLGRHPMPGELCLDLGSAPGGWTWVLAALGARVFSVDKAPLDPAVEASPLVNHCAHSSVFGLEPAFAGAVDWFFCDVACYPERLLDLVQRWIAAGVRCNFVCTIKFQGQTDHDTARAFAAIPGSKVMHLSCNKHELTWVCLGGVR